MGVYDVIRRGIIAALDGPDEDQVKSLCIRANTLADLAMRGRYADSMTAGMLVANVRILNKLTTLLGYPRRKCDIPRVEVVKWGRAREIPVAPSEVVDEARAECLLAKIAGPSVRAQLDIQRECVQGTGSVKELQGEKQVLDVVPPDSAERVQSSSTLQTN